MDLTHRETGRTIRIRVDNVVYRPDGCLLVEALFSGLVDLSSPSADLVARLHPTKAEAFDWVISGRCSVASDGKPIPLTPDVQLHVNGPLGRVTVRHFSDLLDGHQQLRDRGESHDVQATITLAGFEPGAEPVLRRMRDGSLLLVFAFIPPRVTEEQPANAIRFDLDTFGEDIERAAGVPVTWDDKEVFVILRPRGDTVERICAFLQNYWGVNTR